jgi:hypothetical protein
MYPIYSKHHWCTSWKLPCLNWSMNSQSIQKTFYFCTSKCRAYIQSHLWFLVDKEALWLFFEYFSFPLSYIIPPVLRVYSQDSVFDDVYSNYWWRCLINHENQHVTKCFLIQQYSRCLIYQLELPESLLSCHFLLTSSLKTTYWTTVFHFISFLASSMVVGTLFRPVWRLFYPTSSWL